MDDGWNGRWMQDGCTALILAAMDNEVECVKWMLTNMSAKEITHQRNVRASLSLSLRLSIYHGRLKNLSLLSTLNDHSLVSLSLSSRLRPFVRWVRLHRDVLVISFAIGYNANDAEWMERTAFCGK